MERNVIVAPDGFRSREVALFLAQMDDQNRRLTEDTRGATTEELEWQPARGMNSIGMLLAHIAIVEVFWIQVAVTGSREVDPTPQIGIGIDDDGMPIPEEGAHPAMLAGKPLAFYDDLLARARAHAKQVTAGWTDAELDKEWTLTRRRTGATYQVSLRWILYHILEHEAGHYGQVNLLRHHYRRAAASLRHA